MIICSYYTRGTPYEQEAERLLESCKAVGIDCDVYEVPNRRSWDLNTKWKPVVIKRCMNIHDDDVLYVDADATFHAVPDPAVFAGDLCGYVMDKAFWGQRTIKRKFSLMSGTLFFRNSDRSRTLLDAWDSENQLEPRRWDQHNLENAIGFDPQTGKIVDGTWRRAIHFRPELGVLPCEYCAIDRTMTGVVGAVIRHHQASRRLKRKIS